MSVPTHPLLALVDANKNDLKVSLTNYIDLQAEKTFGQLRNRIVHMIEHGEIVLADVNAPVSPKDHLSTNQIVFPPSPSVNPITTESQIKQEYLDTNECLNTQVPIGVFHDVKQEYDDDEDEGEYMSSCDECEDCLKGICGLDGESGNTNNDADSEVDPQIGLNPDDQPNASRVADLIPEVTDDSNQFGDNANDLSLTNESEQKSTMSVQNYENVQTSQPAKEYNQQSVQSTSGLRSPKRKQTPENVVGEDNSNEDVKKAKLQNVDQIQNETKLQVVTLELNCPEPGCMRILESNEMWKQHLVSAHGLVPYKHLKDNVRANQHGQTEYPCTECEVVGKSHNSLIKHWKNFHQAGKFECSVCAFVGNLRGDIYKHQQQMHRSRKFECTHQGCNKAFKTNYQLEQHGRIHSGERPFSCIWDNCRSTFNQLCAAIQHVRVQHFNLPPTIKEQKELNIIDERDPKLYVQVMFGD